jgi:hypothetical protein
MTALDNFLGKDDAAEQEPVNTALEAPEPKPEPEKPAEEPAPEPAEDEPEAGGNLGKALAAERAKRQDWKEKAIRADEAAKARDAELADMKRQMEDLKQRYMTPPPREPQPEPEYIPDPMQDPRGFFQYQQAQMAREALNTRLHLSEAYARDRHGAEKVDAAVQEFKQAVGQNPALYQQMVQHPMPYEFVLQQAEALRLQREIGTDPNAYRARIEAELRERIMAEMQGTAAPVSRAPNLPPSLASARSSAPRAMPPEAAGDMSLNDILRRR